MELTEAEMTAWTMLQGNADRLGRNVQTAFCLFISFFDKEVYR